MIQIIFEKGRAVSASDIGGRAVSAGDFGGNECSGANGGDNKWGASVTGRVAAAVINGSGGEQSGNEYGAKGGGNACRESGGGGNECGESGGGDECEERAAAMAAMNARRGRQ